MSSLPPKDPNDLFRGTNLSGLPVYEDVPVPPRTGRRDVPKTPDRAPSGIVIDEPHSVDDIESLINRLKRNEAAIVSLERRSNEVAQRMLDYLSGAVFALGGNISPIHQGARTFLIAPPGTTISVPW
jgi:cell division inhibitor SepF